MKTLSIMALPLTLMSTAAIGCGGATGPHIRVATATAAQLEAVKDQDGVWYEFQPGDVVPVGFAFLGAVEGGTNQPAALRAKRQFFFVMYRDRPLQISFDGKSFAGPNSSQSIIGVIPREDGKGAQLGWIIYMGESGNPKAELEAAAK
jgi:hypothetical protein